MKFRKNLFKLSLGFAILSLGFSSTAFAMESLPEKPSIESLHAVPGDVKLKLPGGGLSEQKLRFASPFAYGEIAVNTDNPYRADNARKNYKNTDQLKGGFKGIITEYFKRFSKKGEESINSFDDVCSDLDLDEIKQDGVLNFLAETFKYYIESKNKSRNGDEVRVLVFWNGDAREWQVLAGFSPQALVKKLRKEKYIEINPSDFKNICCKIKTKDKTGGEERELEIPSSKGRFVHLLGDVDKYGRNTKAFDAYGLETEKYSEDFNMFVPDEEFDFCEVELYYGSFDEKNLLCSLKGEVEEVKDIYDFSMVGAAPFRRVHNFDHPKYFDTIFWFKYYVTEVLEKGNKLAEVLK